MEGLREFFWGDKNTLVHSLVDGAIKSLFSAVVVAAVAMILIGALEERLELSQRRAALLELRNTALADTLGTVSDSYGALGCVRVPATMIEPACKSRIDAFLALVRSREAYLAALIPGGDFSSMDALIARAEDLRAIRSTTGAGDASDAFA
ncbi:hypothetical protein AB9K41_18100, partial [Cribrihabitans sp. XS_ASV171]